MLAQGLGSWVRHALQATAGSVAKRPTKPMWRPRSAAPHSTHTRPLAPTLTAPTFSSRARIHRSCRCSAPSRAPRPTTDWPDPGHAHTAARAVAACAGGARAGLEEAGPARGGGQLVAAVGGGAGALLAAAAALAPFPAMRSAAPPGCPPPPPSTPHCPSHHGSLWPSGHPCVAASRAPRHPYMGDAPGATHPAPPAHPPPLPPPAAAPSPQPPLPPLTPLPLAPAPLLSPVRACGSRATCSASAAPNSAPSGSRTRRSPVST